MFLTKKKQLYAYVNGQSKLVLGDVKKIVSRMGLKGRAIYTTEGASRTI